MQPTVKIGDRQVPVVQRTATRRIYKVVAAFLAEFERHRRAGHFRGSMWHRSCWHGGSVLRALPIGADCLNPNRLRPYRRNQIEAFSYRGVNLYGSADSIVSEFSGPLAERLRTYARNVMDGYVRTLAYRKAERIKRTRARIKVLTKELSDLKKYLATNAN